ncbi:MAG: CHAT domain-containing protein [Dehalococcoidales bacterium]|nr:CHAT domain-containing protein [Dehalococcoidales bacterium]
MITILFLAGNPPGTERIAFDEEIREIDSRLRSSEYRDLFVIKSHLAVRLSDLQELLLRHKPNIVHFSSHGSTSNEIILQNDAGIECAVPAEALSALFSKFSEHIQFVVLNSCYSQTQAEAIARHIACVIGMSGTITDTSAISFSSAFYQALGYGKDVKSAYDLACNQIQINGLGEHEIPVLLCQKMDPSSIKLQPSEDGELIRVPHQIADNLPSRERIAIDFVGRQKELAILDGWFKDPKSELWVLAGDGGKGKTAIAYEFGINIKKQNPENYYLIQWLSAKRKRFVEGVIIYIDDPDFIDLNTAIDKVLSGYGYTSETSKPLDEKKETVLELLNELPALLIVDDVDSLEGEAENAITFFTTDVTKTPSKVLLTSRRSLFGFGGITTRINGFSREDGNSFVKSRIALFELNPRPIAPFTEKIVKITDGSPLYIEELLRLCKFGVGIKDAIAAWEGVDGDAARAYSLKREFEMLSVNAKNVLLACCLNRIPSTIEDITVITGLDKKSVIIAVEEIGRLFLLPQPTVIKATPRFDININTRSLIIDVMKGSDLYKNLDANVKRLAGELQISGKRRFAITEYLKHSSTLLTLEDFPKAEKVLKEGLTKYGEDPDLLAQLGRIYSRWKPVARLTDAKNSFRRAAELKCAQEDMYHHWWSLECKDKEWTGAVAASEYGLKQFPDSWILKYRAGYAHSRLGSTLKVQFQRDRARYQLTRARFLLENALQSVNLSDLDLYERKIHSDILKSLVFNSEAQGHAENVKRFLKQWLNDHPDDIEAKRQQLRLETKFSFN